MGEIYSDRRRLVKRITVNLGNPHERGAVGNPAAEKLEPQRIDLRAWSAPLRENMSNRPTTDTCFIRIETTESPFRRKIADLWTTGTGLRHSRLTQPVFTTRRI